MLILITDGFPTDAQGNNLQEAGHVPYLERIAQFAREGIITVTVGLGSARLYNSRFLTVLADHGQGRFCYAAELASLSRLLRDEVRRAQACVTKELKLKWTSACYGVRLAEVCRIHPEYRPLTPLEAQSPQAWEVHTGALEAGDANEAIYLSRFQFEGEFDALMGQRKVLDLAMTWTAPRRQCACDRGSADRALLLADGGCFASRC